MAKIDMERAQYIVLGIVITTLLAGAFLLGLSVGWNIAVMKLL